MTNCPPLRAGTPKLSAAGPDRNVTIPSLKVSCAAPGAANANDIAAAEANVASRERRFMKFLPCYFGNWFADCPHRLSRGAVFLAAEFRQPFSARLRRLFRLASIRHLAIKNGDRAGPAGGGALDLHRKAGHHEAGRGQKLQI